MKYKISSEYVYFFNEDSTFESFKSWFKSCVKLKKEKDLYARYISNNFKNNVLVFARISTIIDNDHKLVDKFCCMDIKIFKKYYEII